MKRQLLSSQSGQTTLEYMMVLGFMATIAILVTEWIFDALLLSVSRLAFEICVSLSTFPQ
jgi:hypothetical protein